MTMRVSGSITRRSLLAGGVVAGGVAAGLGVAGWASTPSPAAAADTVTENSLRITKIKNLTGPDLTGRFGVHWADLGIAGRCPDGRTLYVFGDTFGPGWGENWRSPTALWSRTRHLNRGVTFSGTPGGDWAEQLIPYEHAGPPFESGDISTIIPSDVITLGSTMYLHAVVNQGFGNVIWSGIWTSRDNGASWQDSGARFPADAYDEKWQLATWDLGRDGWVYVYTSKFLRQTPMILHRVRPQHLTRPDAYQPWGFDGRRWRWGADPTDVTDGIIGEASLRRLGHHWLLTWFDGPNYRIDAQVLRHPSQDLRATPTVTLLHGTDWDSQDVNHLAQLYGSYIIPGSTLDDTHLTVSQWNTGDNSVYHVMQYRFRGLERLA